VIPYGLLLKALALVAVVAGLFFYGYTAGRASERKEWKLKEAAQVAAQLAATEQARATEQALQKRVNDANTALQTERAKHSRIAADLRTQRDSVRDELSTFIRGSATDTLPSCVERGEAAGVVLLEAVRVAGEFAEAGETCEADKRALIAAWP
jgi:hypothetical protein